MFQALLPIEFVRLIQTLLPLQPKARQQSLAKAKLGLTFLQLEPDMRFQARLDQCGPSNEFYIRAMSVKLYSGLGRPVGIVLAESLMFHHLPRQYPGFSLKSRAKGILMLLNDLSLSRWR